jgi:hypothetical protein
MADLIRRNQAGDFPLFRRCFQRGDYARRLSGRDGGKGHDSPAQRPFYGATKFKAAQFGAGGGLPRFGKVRPSAVNIFQYFIHGAAQRGPCPQGVAIRASL